MRGRGAGAAVEAGSELIGRAQATGALQDYQAYLEAYPSGVFAALADAEIRALRLRAQAAAPPRRPSTSPRRSGRRRRRPRRGPAAAASQQITFLSPLSADRARSRGARSSQIIEGSPQYPPVEGLPDGYWKDKTCSNCHQWTQAALCEQGNTYLTQSGEFALSKQHPIDGFKQVLRDWASEGCG